MSIRKKNGVANIILDTVCPGSLICDYSAALGGVAANAPENIKNHNTELLPQKTK